MRIKVLNRQALHASEHVLPELVEISLCHESHDLGLEDGKYECENIENYEYRQILEGGKIAATGTHDELLKSSAIYREIYEQQTKGGEE